jgi:hypothetical protein
MKVALVGNQRRVAPAVKLPHHASAAVEKAD